MKKAGTKEGSDNLQCRNCPYGKEDFERRMYWYNKTVKESGVPNDIYHYLQPEDAADQFEQFLWCDKVGGKVYCFGHCEDAYETEDSDVIENNFSSKLKRRNKRERDKKHRDHLRYLSEIARDHPSPAIYKDEIYVRKLGYIDNPKPYYRRLYRGKRSGYLKKQSNRKIRRYKGELHKGWQCHKLYDFWWEYD